MTKPGFKIKIKMTGGKELEDAFAKIKRSTIKLHLREAVSLEALRLEAMMKTGIRNQAPGGKKFKPLAESTIERKGSSKALIDRGDLINSINTDFYGGGLTAFVGVSRMARDRDGNRLANIAEIHEFGTDPYKIPVTNKMRFWWLAQSLSGKWSLSPLKRSTTHINHPGIPERSFIRPSYDEWVQDVEENINDHVISRLFKT